MAFSSLPRQDRLIVGVDFGTTFTGVAICYSNTPDSIEVINTWPGGSNRTSEKVPTVLSYDNGFKWGFHIKPGQRRIECIKLFLDQNKDIPDFAFKDDSIKDLKDSGRSVVDAAADYLSEVFNHTMITIRQRFGESLVKSTKLQVIITVPAVWSDNAKHATMTAAEKAGMGKDLKIISEPEAAACYTLKVIQPNHLRVDNNMIVCDAGGGTVDLISYRITKLEPLQLEESSVGSGGLCGAAFLNFGFEEHVRNRMGKDKFAKLLEKKTKSWQTALSYFEDYVKRNCEAGSDEEFNIPFPGIPDDEAAGIDGGFLILQAQQVREIFDPIIKEVIQLIQGQVSSVRKTGGTVAAILLVGGFGQSSYLFERVKEYFRDGSPPTYTESTAVDRVTSSAMTSVTNRFRTLNFSRKPAPHVDGSHVQPITVMQPQNAWTAVVRGAVMRGLEGTIVTDRRSRFHYGITYCPAYDSYLHPFSARYWDKYDNRYRTRDVMRWYVSKGEKVSESRAITFPFYRAWDGEDFPRYVTELTTVLRACEINQAPMMYDAGDMIKVCTLSVPIAAIPRKCWQRLNTSTGQPYWKIVYNIEMRIDSAQLQFALKINGVEYGSINAVFDK